MKKKNNKKYAYVVDLTEIEVLDDIDVVFALAKQDAGLPITDDELMDIVYFAVSKNFAIKMLECIPCIEKFLNDLPAIVKAAHTPWYKKVWNAITYPARKIWNLIKRKK